MVPRKMGSPELLSEIFGFEYDLSQFLNKEIPQKYALYEKSHKIKGK